jgi:hypothetical protein
MSACRHSFAVLLSLVVAGCAGSSTGGKECGPGTVAAGGACLLTTPPTLTAVLHLPLATGAVPATRTGRGADLAATGRYDPLSGTLDVDVRIRNGATMILFNPKLVVTSLGGGVQVTGDGVLDGQPYFNYGPAGLAPDLWSPVVTLHFTHVTAPADVGVRLQTDPAVVFWGSSLGPYVIDSGTHQIFSTFAGAGLVWSTAMSPLGRHVAGAGQDEELRILDLTDGSTLTTTLVPAAGGTGATRLDGVAYSRDGAFLWVAGGTESTGGWIPFLAKLEASGFHEVGRATLPEASSDLFGTVAIDASGARAYLPSREGGQVWVVDLGAMQLVDADGDASNGATPLTLTTSAAGSGVQARAAVVVGSRLYLGFGCPSMTSEIAVVDTTTLVQLPPLLSSTPGLCGTGLRMLLGPDGKLWAPRCEYASQPGDPDSWGLSVFDPASASTTESTRVSLAGSYAAGNFDVWDLVFVPGRNLAYAAMSSVGMLYPFDWSTLQPIDADGDPSNGQTNIDTGAGAAYWATLTVTPY